MDPIEANEAIERAQNEIENLMSKAIGGKEVPDLIPLLRGMGTSSAPTAYPIIGKIKLGSKKASDFMNSTNDLLIGTGSNAVIHILEKSDVDGKLGIFIEVGEDTRHEKDVRPLISLALQWRDCLLEWQGASNIGGSGFLNSLWERKQAGESYGQLAEDVNEQVAKNLWEFIELSQAYEIARPEFKGIAEAWKWVNHSREKIGTNPSAFDNLIYILRSMRFSEEDIVNSFEHGLERIISGREPYLTGEPVSYKKMENTLNYYFKIRPESINTKPPQRRRQN